MPRKKSKRAHHKGLPSEATQSQQAAYAELAAFCTGLAAPHSARVLAGYAGTGKTWLAVQLMAAACEAKLRVAVCAPTHKAVSVILAKLDPSLHTQVWTGTLHALLGLKLKESQDGLLSIELDRHPRGSYFESFDIVFIDEASMVGPLLLSYIERFARSAAPRVLYIGDPGQLLPVSVRDVTDPRQARFDETPEPGPVRPPVFTLVPHHHVLTEIVRQKTTGRAHPIVQFAQELRRYIEGEASGVFDPDAVRRYLAQHAPDLGGAVQLASAARIAEGCVSLRQRRPGKDIRVLAWRNRVVDERNRVIHHALAAAYGAQTEDQSPIPPFWPGETLVAREALYGFRTLVRIEDQSAATWERALAPPKNTQASGGGRRDGLADLIPNNTEMIVQHCVPRAHPYLAIPSWHISAHIVGGDTVDFFVAADAREHQRLIRQTWDQYRTAANRSAEGFRRAWAMTRACAPVTHAYAITAHKAQGSTFHYALVDLADLYGMVEIAGADEYHRALYVAVTRASERIWLCL